MQEKPTSDPLNDIRDRLRRFAEERDWEKFHSPKNLATALIVEAAELLEHFQWSTEDESRSLSADRVDVVSEELADVLIYLVRLADMLNVDLLEATRKKIELNAIKYPHDKASGHRRKYSEL